jgi:hypothetical protein
VEIESVENGEPVPAATATTESSVAAEEPKRDLKRKSRPQRPL